MRYGRTEARPALEVDFEVMESQGAEGAPSAGPDASDESAQHLWPPLPQEADRGQDDLDVLVSPNAGGMVSGVAVGGMANAFVFCLRV